MSATDPGDIAGEDATGSDRRTRTLLALGAAAGLAMAAASLLSAPVGEGELPDGVVARVNDATIRDEEYQRLVAALANDRRTPLRDEDRRHVLDRLIEEELLVQHAVDLGLLHTDRRVRADLVSAVLGSLSAAADVYEPGPEEVESFYAENRDYFAAPGRLWVRELVFARSADRDELALENARQAAARLRAGEPFEAVREALADPPVAPLPAAPLPPAKLREYLGPTALSVALGLEPGQVSEPVPTPQGYLVLVMVERTENRAHPLPEVEPQVRAEMRRRAGDRLLRERLDALRAQADVLTAPGLP